MKAVQISKTGGPEVLEIKEITLGKPAENEVTIEQKAIGLNYIDTYHRSGLYPLELPSGIGAEGAGIVKEVGSNVKDFNVGDKVCYKPDTEYEFEVDGEKLYRIMSQSITGVWQ